MNLPSIKTLSEVFGDNAKKARTILEASHEQRQAFLREFNLESWRAQFYHSPPIYLVKLTILDRLAKTCGVESFQVRNGDHCDYLNTGDTYCATLAYFRGRYRVASWGDIVEKYGSFAKD